MDPRSYQDLAKQVISCVSRAGGSKFEADAPIPRGTWLIDVQFSDNSVLTVGFENRSLAVSNSSILKMQFPTLSIGTPYEAPVVTPAEFTPPVRQGRIVKPRSAAQPTITSKADEAPKTAPEQADLPKWLVRENAARRTASESTPKSEDRRLLKSTSRSFDPVSIELQQELSKAGYRIALRTSGLVCFEKSSTPGAEISMDISDRSRIVIAVPHFSTENKAGNLAVTAYLSRMLRLDIAHATKQNHSTPSTTRTYTIQFDRK